MCQENDCFATCYLLRNKITAFAIAYWYDTVLNPKKDQYLKKKLCLDQKLNLHCPTLPSAVQAKRGATIMCIQCL
jgi:hypothetical protein